jgi:hypothetical protein
MPDTPGKLDVTIKITAIPEDVTTDANGWKAFVLACDGTRVRVRVRPKLWNKLTQGAASWPLWIASITGGIGQRSEDGFELTEPGIQVFERKPKPDPKPDPAAAPPAAG